MEVMDFFRNSMWIVAAATTLVTVGVGVMLGYHWHKYAMSKGAAATAIATYWIVSIVLVLGMIAAIPVF